jgi:hypothetical protein
LALQHINGLPNKNTSNKGIDRSARSEFRMVCFNAVRAPGHPNR